MEGRSAGTVGLISSKDMAPGRYQQTSLDQLSFVMAGLVPANHVLFVGSLGDVDARQPSTPRLRRARCQSAEALAKVGKRPGMTVVQKSPGREAGAFIRLLR